MMSRSVNFITEEEVTEENPLTIAELLERWRQGAAEEKMCVRREVLAAGLGFWVGVLTVLLAWKLMTPPC